MWSIPPRGRLFLPEEFVGRENVALRSLDGYYERVCVVAGIPAGFGPTMTLSM